MLLHIDHTARTSASSWFYFKFSFFPLFIYNVFLSRLIKYNIPSSANDIYHFQSPQRLPTYLYSPNSIHNFKWRTTALILLHSQLTQSEQKLKIHRGSNVLFAIINKKERATCLRVRGYDELTDLLLFC